MTTTARALELLAVLQRGGSHAGPDLARRLGVDQRTLRRDVERLRDLGYGVQATRGATGGYLLGPGASVPPLVLRPEEAVAIAIGLRSIVHGPIGGLDEAAAGALAKLEGSLSNEARERISTVSSATLGLAGSPSIPAETVVVVARAIRERRRLRIRYRRHDGSERDREVEAHRMVQAGDRWYVLAYVPAASAWRTYRLDRLEPSTPLGARFDERAIPDDAVVRATGAAIASAPYAFRCRVIVHAPIATVRERFPVATAEASLRSDGDTDLAFGADDLETAAVYLGVSGLACTIVEPEALRDATRAAGERMLAAADAPRAGAGITRETRSGVTAP